MRRDSKLSSVLHAVLHMADYKQPVSSDFLAECMQTNPVVVRRTMAGLRDVGLVKSSHGRGGGWELAKDLRTISLYDVYMALGEPEVFAIGPRDANPECLVEQAVNGVLTNAFHDAEAVFKKYLCQVTLADLATEFSRRKKHHAPHGRNSHA